ncbi:MAG: DUF3408 domain-containing protein [Bacteroides sp.]|nr:DUF3408 domain-containing protein [Bacteroides sp.]MCM1531463.1 DUF3408 domain-containing protein [Ruminococcus flavefaciens]MCM1554375.1 DUF3408 domain-containing protein [Bacteroides sp.]
MSTHTSPIGNSSMDALLAKMNRSQIQIQPLPEVPEPPVAEEPAPKTEAAPAPQEKKRPGRKKKDAAGSVRPAVTAGKAMDYAAYHDTFLVRDTDEEMGGLRVQLSQRNSRDLRFIATCTGVSLTTLVNNVLRHHIEQHAGVLKTLTRPALSWEERDNDSDNDQ